MLKHYKTNDSVIHVVFHRLDLARVHEKLLKLIEVQSLIPIEVVVFNYVVGLFQRNLGALSQVCGSLLTLRALFVHLFQIVLVLKFKQFVHHVSQAVRIDPLLVSVEHFVDLNNLLVVFRL